MHCNTTIDSAQLLDEGKQLMAHVKVVECWEDGKPTPIPPHKRVRTHVESGGVPPVIHSRVRRRLPMSQGTAL